jgi:hypothetical protein
LRDRERDREEPRAGTLAPERRAWDSPIAMACFRFFTRLPEPPERSLPRFISCIARSTFFPAFGPYRRPRLALRLELRLDVLLRLARLVRLRPPLDLR